MSSDLKVRGGIPAITGEIDYTNAFHIFPETLKPFRSSILAYSSSFLSTLIGFPLDTVKTRMQTHKNFTSYWDCILKTYSKEGIKGFFRGIWAPIVSTSFSKSFSVSIFTAVKPECYSLFYETRFNKDTKELHPFLRNIPVCFVSGLIAGAGVSLFACPFEYTKIYAQLEKLVRNKSLKELPAHMQTSHQEVPRTSTLAIVKQILKHDGFIGLYSGYKYHLLRDAVSTGFYYSIYESMKWASNNVINADPTKSSPFSVLIAGGFSGVLSWVLIFPVDTTKSLVQKDAVTNILRRDQGLAPLPPKHRKLQKFEKRSYRGLAISITRSFLVNMVFFSAYEAAMVYLA
ncbi:integral membrane ornithine transporter of mitochondria [Spathaspora passalidarum NRRL Y-27907]|uniref:Mitochondrial thiamine pyrophosphate carrier 1 n=1 Tax=Spathaspora passalidarum (strain NRRL Y-27907 / 11-Y1) TaxID=619300 RepID=G3AI69_SPAPN|nr:integral membrane ornithine transporter of mitochondria [Spathaspora passalidarum NRRL Y-27907]EGW34383.1 integral membrane ornithine transporter of mitochondria [Spathaspora passalidarum NRRL Y-27907]